MFGSYEMSLVVIPVSSLECMWMWRSWCDVSRVFSRVLRMLRLLRRTSSWAAVSSRSAAASAWSPATRTTTAMAAMACAVYRAAEAPRGGRATRWSTWPWSCRKAAARWPTAPWASAVRASCSCHHPRPGEICGFKVIIGRERNGKERNHNFYMRTEQTK